MLKVLSYILCDLDPKVKVIGQKAGICDGVPSTSALVGLVTVYVFFQGSNNKTMLGFVSSVLTVNTVLIDLVTVYVFFQVSNDKIMLGLVSSLLTVNTLSENP